MIGPQHLDRMAEADALGPHRPIDHRPARVAGTEAVPEILRRSDNERWRLVVMERAFADQVGSVPGQLDPTRLGQPLQGDVFL
jgi:hypothetical protein